MTRFGVMKHLRVLEETGLVTAQRRGREKLHFLNPIPIRLIHDRWVSKYAERWASALSGLRHDIEEEPHGEGIRDIKTIPERLWHAITDGETRRNHSDLYGGWPMILSGLKTLLETGKSLATRISLRFVQATESAA
jgi:DNA-binding transcriptional ArsR family regulator